MTWSTRIIRILSLQWAYQLRLSIMMRVSHKTISFLIEFAVVSIRIERQRHQRIPPELIDLSHVQNFKINIFKRFSRRLADYQEVFTKRKKDIKRDDGFRRFLLKRCSSVKKYHGILYVRDDWDASKVDWILCKGEWYVLSGAGRRIFRKLLFQVLLRTPFEHVTKGWRTIEE